MRVANGRHGDEVANHWWDGIVRHLVALTHLETVACPTERQAVLPPQVDGALVGVAPHCSEEGVPKGNLERSRLGKDRLPHRGHWKGRIKHRLHLAAGGQVTDTGDSALRVERRVIVDGKRREGVTATPAEVAAEEEAETAAFAEPERHARRLNFKVSQLIQVDEQVTKVILARRNGEGGRAAGGRLQQRGEWRRQALPRRRRDAGVQQKREHARHLFAERTAAGGRP